MRLEEAVAKVKEEYGNDDNVKIMLDFIAKSDRGIAR